MVCLKKHFSKAILFFFMVCSSLLLNAMEAEEKPGSSAQANDVYLKAIKQERKGKLFFFCKETIKNLYKQVDPYNPLAVQFYAENLINAIQDKNKRDYLIDFLCDSSLVQYDEGYWQKGNIKKIVSAGLLIAWIDPIDRSCFQYNYGGIDVYKVHLDFDPRLITITPNQDYIVLASGNQLVAYNIERSQQRTYNPSQGFEITAVACDNKNRILIGDSKGSIGILEMNKILIPKISIGLYCYFKNMIMALCWISKNRWASCDVHGTVKVFNKKSSNVFEECIDLGGNNITITKSAVKRGGFFVSDDSNDFYIFKQTKGINSYKYNMYRDFGSFLYQTSDGQIVTKKNKKLVLYKGKNCRNAGDNWFPPVKDVKSHKQLFPLYLLQEDELGTRILTKQIPSSEQLLFKMAVIKAKNMHEVEALKKLLHHEVLKTFKKPLRKDIKQIIKESLKEQNSHCTKEMPKEFIERYL